MSNATNQTLTNINCPSIGSFMVYGVMNISGFFLNVVLIILIIKHTTPQLRPYSEVLITSCGVDVFSSFFQFLTQARPTFQGKNSILTFSMDGMLPWWIQNTKLFAGGNLNYILIPEYIGCYFSVCYCCVPFVYRYLMICWNHQMRRFEFFGLVFILFSLSLFCSITINIAAAGAYDINMEKIPIPNPNCTRFLPQFAAGLNDAALKYESKVFELWSNGTMVILCTYLITIFCLVRIQFFFFTQVRSNPVQNKIQRQISWTLALQALTSLLAFYGPQTMFQILLKWDIKWFYAFEMLFICYSAVPVLNSITVFILIASYRSAFFTLASNVGYQILTTVRLSKYVTAPSTTIQPLFENKSAQEKQTTENRNSFMIVQDF